LVKIEIQEFLFWYKYIYHTMESQEKPQIVAPMKTLGINLWDIIARAIKYIVEGGAVAVAAYFIPRKSLKWQEIVMIALTAAAVFAILDLFAPAVGLATRQGAGFGIGAGLVGFGGVPLAGGVIPGVPPMA
jgi:hypothetical protein